jgi:hypothetical protein
MGNESLDYFGKKLIEAVRDSAVTQWRSTLAGKMKDAKSQEIYKKLHQDGMDKNPILGQLISAVTDTCLHNFLWLLEQNPEIILSVTTKQSSSQNLAEESDGLAGELYGEKGWIKRFSKINPI